MHNSKKRAKTDTDAPPTGFHGIWHIFIVLAMRAHRDGIREMRRAAAEGGCAIRAGPGA
jgi:hypothetical protein